MSQVLIIIMALIFYIKFKTFIVKACYAMDILVFNVRHSMEY